MPVLQGHTSGSITSLPYNIKSTIKSWSLTNKTGGALTVILAIIPSGTSTPVYIWEGSIAANSAQSGDDEVTVLTGSSIFIMTSGSIDYYISIE